MPVALAANPRQDRRPPANSQRQKMADLRPTSSEFRLMVKPETVNYFSDYVSGGFVILCIGALGFLMLKVNNATAEQYAPADAEMPRR